MVTSHLRPSFIADPDQMRGVVNIMQSAFQAAVAPRERAASSGLLLFFYKWLQHIIIP